MRVLTYNLHQGLDRAGRPMLEQAAAAIASRAPDIVACQEVLDGDEPELAEQAKRLARHLGMDGHFVPNAVVGRGRLGNAIFTARPVAAVEHLPLEVSRYEPRGLLRVELREGTAVWNVHLGLTRGERSRQWRSVAAVLESAARRVVMCGDFNDWSGGLDRIVRRAGLVNSLGGLPRARRRTFPARWPLLALDRVYVRGMKVRGARVLGGEPWVRLSDHLPVEVDLSIDPKGT